MTDRPPFFFTSYAERPADNPLVEAFHARLQREVEIKRGRTATHEGFLNVGSIRLGQGWRRMIGSALGRTRFLVVLLTDDYLSSPWCAREWAVMKERTRQALPAEPVSILPLFWTRLTRELPDDVAELQLRMATLGAAYTETCLVDLMRGDAQTYEKFVIGLTDHMIQSSGGELPEMDADLAASYPPAFGLRAPEEVTGAAQAAQSAGVITKALTGVEPAFDAEAVAKARPASAEETTPVADVPSNAESVPEAPAAPHPPAPFKKADLISAFIRSPISGPRDVYELWLDSVRLLMNPTPLAPITDSGALRPRVTALINFAQSQKTPDVLLAYAEALEDLGDDEATTEVRRLVDLAARTWWKP